jgi:S1-C subfamily serine protease
MPEFGFGQMRKDRGMNWVDVLLLVVVAVAAVHGLRLGAVMQVFSFGGFWLGLLVGAVLTPVVAGAVHSPLSKSVVVIVVFFGCAGLLGTVGRVVGARSSRAVQRHRLGPLDAGLGVGVAVIATLLATWLVAGILVDSRYTTLDTGLEQSHIVRALDSVLDAPPPIFSRVASFLAAEGFPVVFAGLPPAAAGPVTLPADVRAESDAAAPSTLKVVGEACGLIQEGSGFVAAPGLVVTNAHVVAGVARPQVVDTSGGVHDARAVLFDPELDLAVLHVPGLHRPALPIDPHPVTRGTTGAALGFPGGGPLSVQPAGVRAAFAATGLDIYGRSNTVRRVYELDATIRPGNSGGPLVLSDGEVVGVVFARSTTDADVGYALASPAVFNDVQRAEHDSRTVATGACVS